MSSSDGENTETWTVSLKTSAARDLDKLPAAIRERAEQLFEQFREDPFPPGAIKMRSSIRRHAGELAHTWRVRIGRKHRCIYDVNEHSRRVVIIAVRPRDDRTYKEFDRW